MTPVELVIGVDAGGTSTRCQVAALDGRPVGVGTAAGLNQRSSGGDPVDRLVQAIGAALGKCDRSTVRAGVLGVAGAGAAGLAEVRRQAAAAWHRLDLAGEPVVVTDLLAAFAAGTAEPRRDAVLVGGTGAGAAAVVDRQVVRQADGAGWLLGDVGSAVWLAREALVAAVAALDGRGPATALTEPLLAALLGRPAPYTVQDVIAAAYSAPPASIGRLAPVVTELADRDPAAADIVRRGVAGLLASLDAVRTTAPGQVVLAGALLTTPGPVLAGVTEGIAERGLGAPSPAHQPAAGAAWLALVSLGVTEEQVHARLSSPTAPTRPQ